MVDFDLNSDNTKATVANTEREVIHNVLNNLSKTIRYCDEWANHCYVSDSVDNETDIGTFLDSVGTTLNNCRRAVLDTVQLHKVCYCSTFAASRSLSFCLLFLHTT